MERLDKLLSGTGHWSRREVKELIRQGRVLVSGQLAQRAEQKVDPGQDTLEVDVSALKELDCRYIFSRIAVTNYEELSLELLGPFTEESSPYVLYVYRVR